MTPGNPLLLDLTELSEPHTDAALEHIYKAISDDPPDGDIWEPHHSLFLRQLIERFTERGLTRIGAIQTELAKWLNHEMHRAGRAPFSRPDVMARWTDGELSLVKLYLETLPPAQFALGDWMLVVDYLVQRYLPHDHLVAEADWLATRAVLMGRVQANLANITERQAARVLEDQAVAAAAKLAASRVQQSVLQYGRARAAENIVSLTDGMRHRIRKTLIDHQEAVTLGDRTEDLQGKLLEDFGQWNRDWRRIAVTEVTEMSGQGMIAALPVGSRVRRVEMYNCCSFCKKIDGMEFTVVPADQRFKDPWKHFWTWKTNVGRSASPRKRVGGVLIPREPEEMWVPVPGATHPHCRGLNIRLSDQKPGDDPEFADWLKKLLDKPK
jgi:hypothetical protein